MLTFITSIFKKENFKTLMVVAIGLLLFLWLQQCDRNSTLKSNLDFERKVTQQNFKAINDSIKATKDAVGNIEFDKTAYMASLDDLKLLNDSLYKAVENVKGDVLSLIKSKVQGEIKPIEVANNVIKYDDLTYGLKSHINDEEPGFSYEFDVISRFKLADNKIYPGLTNVDNHKFSLDLTYGFKETDDSYEVFAKSASPSIIINELDGVLILPKDKSESLLPTTTNKKRWGIGPAAVGYYDFNTKRPAINLGLSIQYNMIRF